MVLFQNFEWILTITSCLNSTVSSRFSVDKFLLHFIKNLLICVCSVTLWRCIWWGSSPQQTSSASLNSAQLRVQNAAVSAVSDAFTLTKIFLLAAFTFRVRWKVHEVTSVQNVGVNNWTFCFWYDWILHRCVSRISSRLFFQCTHFLF